MTGRHHNFISSLLKNKIFLFVLGISVLMSLLYHNDKAYIYFESKINTPVNNHFRVDLLKEINQVTNKVDIVGFTKRTFNTLQENEYVDLYIDSIQQKKLDKYLAKTPVKKKWVKGQVKMDTTSYKAKIKFHGTHIAHYIDNKYSYSVKISKKGDYKDNFRRFKLIKGEQASPTICAVNKLAQDIGLISTAGKMVMLRINGIEQGHYYFVEDIRKEYLEREMGITNYSMVSHTSDWSRKEKRHQSSLDWFHGHLDKEKDLLHPKAVNQFRLLAKAVNEGDKEKVASFFDTNYMAKYLALAYVFNDIHFMTGDNFKLIYDFSRGKFYPIYRAETGGITPEKTTEFPDLNTMIFSSHKSIYANSENNKLFSLLLANNQIRDLRDQQLYSFIDEQSSYIDSIKAVYTQNQRIMLHSRESRKEYYHKKRKQLNLVSNQLELASRYLNYHHIYGSYDSLQHKLILSSDSYTPFDIYYNQKKLGSKIRGIEFDNSLQAFHNSYDIDIDLSTIKHKAKKLTFINSLNGDTIKDKLFFNYIEYQDQNTSTYQKVLDESQVKYVISNDTLFLKKGRYFINNDLFLAPQLSCSIEAGTELLLGEGVNVCFQNHVEIKGKKDAPVVVKNKYKDQSFGTFAIIGQHPNTQVNMQHFSISGGSESFFLGYLFTGQFAIYKADATLKNVHISNSMGDDGLNAKYSKVSMEDCVLENNKADQLDLDFCTAIIKNNVFTPSLIDSNGDGLDFSGSYALVSNNTFEGFVDKGLSLGENSKILVQNNHFISNQFAMAVKDQTQLLSWENRFENNTKNYQSFIKKKIFNQPILYIQENISEASISNDQGILKPLSENTYMEEREKFEQFYRHFQSSASIKDKQLIKDLISTTMTIEENL